MTTAHAWIVERYRAALAATDPAAETRAFEAHCARFGGAYPPTSITPYFCPRAVRATLEQASRELAAALAAASRRFFAGGPTAVRIPRHLERLVHARHAQTLDHPVFRVDAFLRPESGALQVLEINAADPSAYAWNDHMLDGLAELPSIHGFAREAGLTWDEMVPRHAAVLRAEYADFCAAAGAPAKPRPRVALSIAAASTVRFDFLCLEARYAALGWDAFVCEPQELAWSDGGVWARGAAVDAVVRDTLDEVVAPDGRACGGDLPRLLAEGRVACLNPTASTYGDQKTALCDLRLPDPALVLPTVKLTAATAARAARERSRWVLKPANGYGGLGVVLGLACSDADFAAQLRAACAADEDFVLQEYAPAPRESSLVAGAHGAPEWSERLVVFSFWVMGGVFAGAFVRRSAARVINFHQGGSLVPVMYYE